MAEVVLSILAHPDDAEFLCAGTLTRLSREQGWQVHIATMTAGDCGSAVHGPEEIARIRRAEGTAAAAVIGGTYHCAEERDLLVMYNQPALEKVVRLIRTVRPSVLITHNPADYHLDHEGTSTLVRAAAFAAPIPNFLREPDLPPIDHIPHLYYCDPIEGKDQFGVEVKPFFCIDVSRVVDVKEQMLAKHASQRDWLLKHHGMDQYLVAMRELGAMRGQPRGVAYAEGFRQHLGHSFPQGNIIGDLLGTVETL